MADASLSGQVRNVGYVGERRGQRQDLVAVGNVELDEFEARMPA